MAINLAIASIGIGIGIGIGTVVGSIGFKGIGFKSPPASVVLVVGGLPLVNDGDMKNESPASGRISMSSAADPDHALRQTHFDL